MEKDHIVYKAKEVICLHCGEKQSLTSTNYAEWLDECVLFREEHKNCKRNASMGKTNCAHCAWDGDTQKELDKLAEHVANLEAEVALLNNAVSAQPTLRDSMAAHALTGLLACPMSGTPSSFSKLAYKYADAMLKEREK